ncbi:TRAP transporter large permease [Bacillus sp. FJAT-29814]|uniref:TRAP transporter large permease n=1 Tax=Bacillus sp. FJAT-29814 TaxID=1729688 RepID=UPI0008345FB2|nr:TRAP transporter large permease [Bacillus sp. FJAT-29814]
MDILFLFIGVFLLAGLIRVPIAFSMGIAATLAILYSGNKLGLIAPATLSALDSFPYLAIPAFVYAGDLMANGGISKALINFIQELMGKVRGSLAMVTVLASAVFGAVTGSAMATVSAIGSITIPEMVRYGYKREYATALVSASGFIGILIPPSVPGIMYAISTGTSISDVWLATVIPGLLIALAYILVIAFNRKHLPEVNKEFTFSLKRLSAATPRFLVAILMPIIIFAGIYGGIFTPTEAGAIVVVYGIIAGWVIFKYVFKEKTSGSFWKVTSDSAVNSASISILIVFAAIAGKLITLSGVAIEFATFMTSVSDSPIVFLLILTVLLLFLGMVMETNTVILILAPLIAPAAKAFGLDLVHIGAIMVLNLGIGMITPPFAACLFVGCRIGNITFDRVLKPLLPFLLVTIPVLLIITFWPDVSLFLPKVFSK